MLACLKKIDKKENVLEKMSHLYVSTSLFSTIKKVPVTNVVYEVNITTACFIYKCLQMFFSFVPLLHLFISTETDIAFKAFSFHTDGDYSTNKQLIRFSGISTFMPHIFSQFIHLFCYFSNSHGVPIHSHVLNMHNIFKGNFFALT